MFLFILSGWLNRVVIRPWPFSLMQVQKLPSGCELAPHLHLLHQTHLPPPQRANPFLWLSNTHKQRRGELSISIWITQMNSIFWWQTDGPAGQPPLICHLLSYPPPPTTTTTYNPWQRDRKREKEFRTAREREKGRDTCIMVKTVSILSLRLTWSGLPTG